MLKKNQRQKDKFKLTKNYNLTQLLTLLMISFCLKLNILFTNRRPFYKNE